MSAQRHCPLCGVLLVLDVSGQLACERCEIREATAALVSEAGKESGVVDRTELERLDARVTELENVLREIVRIGIDMPGIELDDVVRMASCALTGATARR